MAPTILPRPVSPVHSRRLVTFQGIDLALSLVSLDATWDPIQTALQGRWHGRGCLNRIARLDGGCNYTLPGDYEVGLTSYRQGFLGTYPLVISEVV